MKGMFAWNEMMAGLCLYRQAGPDDKAEMDFVNELKPVEEVSGIIRGCSCHH